MTVAHAPPVIGGALKLEFDLRVPDVQSPRSGGWHDGCAGLVITGDDDR
jgi:hypothetical protein